MPGVVPAGSQVPGAAIVSANPIQNNTPELPGGGTFTTRTLASGVSTLDYNIFRDLANTQIWGDGTAPSSVNSGSFNFSGVSVGTTLVQTFTAHGTIPAHSLTNSNDRPPGTYTRNITATLRRLTPLDASTALHFRCTSGSIFYVGLGGSVGSRTMAGPGGDTLGYELYGDAARATTWGNTQDTNTVATDDTADPTGNGMSTLNSAQSRSVYGHIPAGQDKNAGAYSSTLTVTIYF